MLSSFFSQFPSSLLPKPVVSSFVAAFSVLLALFTSRLAHWTSSGNTSSVFPRPSSGHVSLLFRIFSDFLLPVHFSLSYPFWSYSHESFIYSFDASFIHSTTHLLSTYYMPSTMRGTRNTVKNNTEMILP